MGKSSANDSFMRVVEALNDIAGDVIVWPDENRRTAIREKFRRTGQLPNVIGAIDGTKIPIKAPKVFLYTTLEVKKEVLIFFEVVCLINIVFHF